MITFLWVYLTIGVCWGGMAACVQYSLPKYSNRLIIPCFLMNMILWPLAVIMSGFVNDRFLEDMERNNG